MIINLMASVAMGLFFGLQIWILFEMEKALLFYAISFALSALAEAWRRWLIKL